MKKSLLLLLMCIGANAATAWAQDDDVYFVPSEKAQSSSQPKHTQKHAYDTYDPVANDNDFQESNWAEGRGNGNWDVDSYNRRGKNYKGQCDEEKSNAVIATIKATLMVTRMANIPSASFAFIHPDRASM